MEYLKELKDTYRELMAKNKRLKFENRQLEKRLSELKAKLFK